jgi:predicted RNA-binding protein YlqC (UPF0109 family)
MAEKDQAFVEYVAKELVDKPEAVKVERSVDEMGVLIELTVDKDDMGVIIGKEGKTAKAMRTLLRVLGAKNDARVNLKIVEPEGSERPERKEETKDVKEEAKSEEKPEKAPEVEEKEEVVAEEAPKEEEEEERPMADLEL